MEITWRVISGEEEGEDRGEGTRNKKHNWQVSNRQGEVKNSIGNGEAKELICTTNRLELSMGRDYWWERGCCTERDKGEKNMGQLEQHNQ